MNSLTNLQLHHQPFHLSFTPKTPKSLHYKPLIQPIKASSSKSQHSIIKSTCITLTTAATLLLANLHLKSPAIAAPITPPPSLQTQEQEQDISLDEQEKTIEQHLTTHPSDTEALRSLMEVKIKSRKPIEAIEIIDRLIELEPEETEWPVLKANVYSYSGDLDSAKTGFEAILDKDPLSVEAYHGLVMTYSDSGLDLKDVEKRIEEAMVKCKKEENGNDVRDLKLLVAQIRVIEGKHGEALKLYQELSKEEPRDFRPYLCQGIIYTLLKKKDKAEEQFDKFRRLVPENHPYREYFMDNMIATKLFSEKTQREIAESKI